MSKAKKHTSPCVCRREHTPWLGVIAVAGLTTAAALLVARRVRHNKLVQSAEDLVSACDSAVQALEKRMSSDLSLAG